MSPPSNEEVLPPTPPIRRQSSVDPMMRHYQHKDYIHVKWVKELVGHIEVVTKRKGKDRAVLKLTNNRNEFEHEKSILEELKVLNNSNHDTMRHATKSICVENLYLFH